MSKKRIVIIGGGPGGYVAAIRAAQIGAEVTLVEKGELGGTCLNRGCIPTKVLLHTVELYEQVREGKKMGLEVASCSVNWQALMRRKQQVVSRLTGGVGMLLQKRGVTALKGTAVFNSPKELVVTDNSGKEQKLDADAFIIATGSVPAIPPVPGFDLAGIATSDEALSFDNPPQSLLLVGGGVIGVELASVFAPLGTEVTIVEMLPEILPNVDAELVALMRKALKAGGISVHTGASVGRVTRDGAKFAVSVGGATPFEKSVEKVLVCAGRRPNTAGLGLDNAGVTAERGRIRVDNFMRTNVDGIYAVGDCASPIMLAHVASHEGEVAVENIMGHKREMSYKAVPGAIYTSPEIAWVGLTEEEAAAKGYAVNVGRFPLAANGKCLIMNDTGGMVKIVADAKHGEVLGVHIMGPRATDLIAEAALGMNLEVTVDEIVNTIHAHPTVSEAVAESAMAVLGRSLHSL